MTGCLPFPLWLLLAPLLGCLLWGVVGSARVVTQVRYCPPVTPADYGLPWEPLQLTTEDDISLSGWLIRHPNPEGILLLLHGFGTCKADLLDLAKAFHESGPYHLVLIDFRGHGESGGKIFSFGKKEILDVQAVLEFLANDPAFRRLPIGCLGVSMGGSIGLLAASRFSQIRAVVSDSPYADLAGAIARTQWLAYHIPRVPLGQMVIWGTEIRLRCRMAQLSPVHEIGKIAPRSVLIIHGTEDKAILPQEAETLFRVARQPRQLWLVPGAEHVGAFYSQPEEYLHRVMGFFADAFSRTT